MQNLDQYLRDRSDWINRELERRLPAADARPAALHAAMRYSLFPGGKRLRPILCLAAADAVQPAPTPTARESALLGALAVEILHTYTLVHDDLPCMDDDDTRRGKPTVHVVYGEANAVLVGDALQALAFEWLAAADAPIAGRLVAELALAAGSRGVVGGQVEDIAAAGTRPDADTLAFIHRHKTGDLFRAAVRLGAMAVGASAAQLTDLTRYGACLGEAFQITDDLLDDGAPPPKPAGRPARPPSLSCLSVMSRAEAQRKAAALLDEAIAAVQDFAATGRDPLVALAQKIRDRQE